MGKAITGGNPPRRGRGGSSGSIPNPAHTPSSNIIPSPNFEDYVPDDLIEEQINKIFEVSKSIPEDDEQEQPTKPKQRKPPELKSPLFVVHYTKTDDVETGPRHFLSKCNYCSKYTSSKKEKVTGHSMAICKDIIPTKLASSLIKPNFEARRRRLMPQIKE
ncbi:hypothetical protein OROMI_003560 [Orobanche minor]